MPFIFILLLLLGSIHAAERNQYLELGNEAFSNQQYSKALSHYQTSLKMGENPAMVWFNIGNLMMKIDQTGQAVVAFEKAIAIAPEFIQARINLGVVYFQLNEIGEALRVFENVLYTDPENEKALQLSGECYLRLGEYAKAVRYLEYGAKSNPEDLSWSYGLADVYLKLDDYSSVQAVLDEALKQHPRQAELYFYLADIMIMNNQNSKAMDMIYQGLRYDDKNVMARKRLAQIHEEEGNLYLAAQTMEKLLTDKKNAMEGHVELARLNLKMGETEKAFSHYEKAARMGAENAKSGLMQVAMQFANQGKVDQAKKVVHTMSSLYPGDPETSDFMSEILPG